MYRILIVEDDMGIASAMKKQIEMWDLEVRCVENFRNVLEEFSEFDPQLVLLDISLPFYIIMDITGVRRFGSSQKYRLFLFPRLRII